MSTLFGSIYHGSESKIGYGIEQFSDGERLVALAQIYLEFSLPPQVALWAAEADLCHLDT